MSDLLDPLPRHRLSFRCAFLLIAIFAWTSPAAAAVIGGAPFGEGALSGPKDAPTGQGLLDVEPDRPAAKEIWLMPDDEAEIDSLHGSPDPVVPEPSDPPPVTGPLLPAAPSGLSCREGCGTALPNPGAASTAAPRRLYLVTEGPPLPPVPLSPEAKQARVGGLVIALTCAGRLAATLRRRHVLRAEMRRRMHRSRVRQQRMKRASLPFQRQRTEPEAESLDFPAAA